MEGPRAVRPAEVDSLRDLTGRVFRPSLMDEYPQLFEPGNYDNLRVMVEGGRCVSHVGMTRRSASIFGCTIGVCCVGAVCTLPEFRGRGLASACMDDAISVARASGADIMLVSGSRGLYSTRGCVPVGRGLQCTVEAGAEPKLAARAGGVLVAPMTDAELPDIVRCYRAELVRFMRPPEDYARALQCRFVMNHLSEFLAVRRSGEFAAYLIMHAPGDDRAGRIVEYAGDRRAILASLPGLFAQYGLALAGWYAPSHDEAMTALCGDLGITSRPAHTPGTLKILDFAALMANMRPRIEELIGRRDTSRLAFEARDSRFIVRFDSHAVDVDRNTATRVIFGSMDTSASVDPAPGPVGDILRRIFPLPCLWYGLNYV